MRFRLLLVFSILLCACTKAETRKNTEHSAAYLKARNHWVDSVYNKLSEDERIGQLFMVAAYSGGPNANAEKIEGLLKKHQIGGLIFMQGGPVRQALLTNRFQEMAQVPLLIGMDAEWGLGMRLDSVANLPKQMTLGAANDSALTYAMGMLAAYQCKRLGVHVNFAPVVDVNNNPDNPVINARSFGEDKYRVSRLGIAYMRGMQDNGIIACAKHFPGHGDVTVDSHKDLPLISKSREELDTLELYPFREMIAAGVKSIMVAHLAVPALEPSSRVPTTLSRNVVTGLLRERMGFQGLVFTDALDMKGVTKYYGPGEVDLRAFAAGNDVLLFSQDVPTAIAKIKAALHSGRATQATLQRHVKKILSAKYDAGLAHFKPISTRRLTEELNHFTPALNEKAAEASLTLVRNKEQLAPLKKSQRVLLIDLGGDSRTDAELAALKSATASFRYVFVPKGGATQEALQQMKQNDFDVVAVAVRGLSFYPGRSYGLGSEVLRFLKEAASRNNTIVAVMGNAYALKYACDAGTLVCGFEDNEWTNAAFVNWLCGKAAAPGSLPVTPPCLR
jgi:beta-glucosidase-like glycosyl hydrolase